MKTQLLQRPPTMALPQKVTLLAFVLSFLLSGFAHAQFFNAAVGTEYTFPGAPGPVNVTTHSFTYTVSHISWMSNIPGFPPPAFPPSIMANPPLGPLTDLTVHSWDDPGSTAGFSFISTANLSGTPGTVYDQGTVVYPPGVQDIELSLMQDEMGFNMFIWGSNAPWYIIVSYYNPTAKGGGGHFVDVYRWNRPPPYGPGGVTLISKTRLSTIANFTRISQDAHNTYGFCITWENPATGIDFVYGFMCATALGVAISPVYTLPGTMGETHPDVAFTHSGTGLNLQFLYYSRNLAGVITITQSTIPFVTGCPGTWPIPPPPLPVINDLNVLPMVYPPPMAMPNLKTRIDAPDHGTDDWAYSYIMPTPAGFNTDIYVRVNNAAIYTTYDITNGTTGPLPINTLQNDWPVLSYDQGMPMSFNVEWYTQFQPGGFFFPNTGGYISLQMTQAGAVTSLVDYLQVGEAATLSNTMASQTPTIASSKQDDRTDYQYVVFSNFSPTGAGNVMQDKDRPWANATFKGGHNSEPWAGMYNNSAVSSVAAAEDAALAFPNPFADKIELKLTPGLADQSLNISIEDISGKVMGAFTAKGLAVNTTLGELSSKLADGIYLMRINSESKGFNKIIKIQKLNTK